MSVLVRSLVLLVVLTAAVLAGEPSAGKVEIYPEVRTYLQTRAGEFDQISNEHKVQLKAVALYIKGRAKANQPVRVTFICTHNSRRSHLSQVWSATAASYYGVNNVETFSGGTEATAFNPRAIEAIKRAGLKVEKAADKNAEAKGNPRYAVRFQDTQQPLICFSKVYNEAPNPKANFCAVLTCSKADQECPLVNGSSLRVAIPFDDPKVADNTPEEAAKYDERCAQVCREMLYLFSQVVKE